MQENFPKYNFNELDKMLSLTNLKKDFKFEFWKDFHVDSTNFNNCLKKLNINFEMKNK